MSGIANQAVLFMVLILLFGGYYIYEYGTDGLEELFYKVMDKLSKMVRRINKI